MKCAYVTLVMLGDFYVPGAVALAKSLMRTGTKYNKVCMITEDVRKVSTLEKVFDAVVVVPYLRFAACGAMLTDRQQNLYGDWIQYAFTKWRCLTLTQFDKCVYLDADQVVVRNIDHLFDLKAPALCFNKEYSAAYASLRHGQRIPPKRLRAFFRREIVLGFTGTMLLRPNHRLMQLVQNKLSVDNKFLSGVRNRFHNGFEEIVWMQVLIEAGLSATHLSNLYVWNAGNYEILKNNAQPYVINYYGDQKPWSKTTSPYWMDVFIWWYFYNLSSVPVDASPGVPPQLPSGLVNTVAAHHASTA